MQLIMRFAWPAANNHTQTIQIEKRFLYDSYNGVKGSVFSCISIVIFEKGGKNVYSAKGKALVSAGKNAQI